MKKHWRIEQDDETLCWLHFNMTESQTNLLSQETLEELDQVLKEIGRLRPAGLIICSDKKSGFITGADVKEFAVQDNVHEVEAYIKRVHATFALLESFNFPTIALIHGFCLGGGLELALACRYRIARDDENTRLGFPEVRLGIFPGFGGTVRSTQLIGGHKAMELMLSGRTLSARAAKRYGLIDLCVPERQFITAVREMIRQKPAGQRLSLTQRLLATRLMRPAFAQLLKHQVARRINPQHYPGPYRLIDHWTAHSNRPVEMYASEAHQVAELVTSNTAQSLVRVFLLQERLKTLGRDSAFKPEHVHVIGAGAMGGDIAAWCAFKGMRVTLQDQGPAQLSRALKRAYQLFAKKRKRPRLIQETADRLIPDHKGYGIEKADVLIEAIFEDVDAKRSLYRDVEPRLKATALLATNTSSIPLETLNAQMQQPARLVGLHFFNPVSKMPLVEIVHGPQTDPEQTRHGAVFVKQIDRLPLPVASSPGFLVNRILMPYLLQAVALLEDGVAPEQVDRAATDFGMPMGPIELADAVGLDICNSVAEKMAVHFGNQVPQRLHRLVELGHLGIKSGKGFYAYKGKKIQKDKKALQATVDPALADRMILRMLNEAIACLREGIVADADLLDAGVIFGAGFAPFRGGPMQYIRQSGQERLLQQLRAMSRQPGASLSVDRGWELLTIT